MSISDDNLNDLVRVDVYEVKEEATDSLVGIEVFLFVSVLFSGIFYETYIGSGIIFYTGCIFTSTVFLLFSLYVERHTDIEGYYKEE